MLKVYCDGAASNNGDKEKGVGGWGYIVLDSQDKIIKENCGGKIHMTNQQAELTAMFEGCRAAAKLAAQNFTITEIEVYSDSAYCINCYQQKWWKNWIKNGWVNSKREPVANRELWEQLIPYFSDPTFNFIKVKGHSTNQFNNYVDSLAVNARLSLT